MNTADARWRVAATTGDEAEWELILAELGEYNVEGIVEMEGGAEIYFVQQADATAAAARFGWPAPQLGPAGGGEVFGQTLHPTTELCIALLQASVKPGDCVADIGSGSGRLSTEALRLGAGLCVAADLDWPAAVASLVALREHTSALVIQGSADALRLRAFDGVVANLHLGLWRELAPAIGRIAKQGSWLVASGFLEDQESEACTMLDGWGWYVHQVEEDNGWLGIRAKRTM